MPPNNPNSLYPPSALYGSLHQPEKKRISDQCSENIRTQNQRYQEKSTKKHENSNL